MNRLIKLSSPLLTIALLITCAPLHGAPNLRIGSEEGNLFDDPALKARVNEGVAAYMSPETHPVGLALGMIRGERQEMATYGTVSPGSEESPTPQSIFEVASMTKTFTATLLALYLQRHPEHHLDDPVQQFLPAGIAVPSVDGRTIELVDLATQTSGLPLYPAGFDLRSASNDGAPRDLCAAIGIAPLRTKPGTRYEYSNTGYSLLAQALINAEDQTWEQLAEKQIASPLGLADTKLRLNFGERRRRLTGFAPKGNALPLDPPFRMANNRAAGLYSTLDDMVKWLRFNLGQAHSPLDAVLPVLQQPRHEVNAAGEQIGLGWQMSPPASNRHLIFTSGDGPSGFHCCMVFDNQRKTGVVVLTNYVNRPAGLALKVMNVLATAD